MSRRRPEAAPAPRSTRAARALAWGVHVLTASGAVVGLAALLATARGDPRRRAARCWSRSRSTSVDGTLARARRVERVLPRIDGRRLDDIVDYLNYVIVPAVFLAGGGQPRAAGARRGARARERLRLLADRGQDRGRLLPRLPVLLERGRALPLSCSSVAARRPRRWWSALSIGVFVPLKYLYPSQMTRVGPRHERGRGASGSSLVDGAAALAGRCRATRACSWLIARLPGRLRRALVLARRLLAEEPACSDAATRTGVLLVQLGTPGLAEHARRAPLSARVPVGSARDRPAGAGALAARERA